MKGTKGRRGVLRVAGTAGLLGAGAMALALAVSAPAERAAKAAPEDGKRAKNVIFLHGDGMSSSARELIRLATVGRDEDLVMNQLPVAGLSHTDPDDPEEPVTDSAAGADAFSIGVKTYNGAIGVDVDGNPIETVLERARDAGKATGLVTTAQVTDASPAAFAAHVPDRAQQSEIARQYLEHSKPDVILGGGEDRWFPPGNPGAYPDNPPKDPTEQSSSDRGNLVAQAESLGYDYVSTREELRRSRARKLLGLFANEEMFEQRVEGDGDLYEPVVSLPEMTRKALDVLARDRQGFFLVVEEEAIDEFSHRNNAEKTIQSGEQLDKAVDVALRFAASHPGTLIIVAADHETGGLAIENDTDTTVPAGGADGAEDGPFPIPGTDLQFTVDWTTTNHTGGPTPVSAYGPGSEALDGFYPNTHIHDAMVDALGLEDE
jgi:alkaline phosphatase